MRIGWIKRVRDNHGFTLVELLLVIAILGILATVVVMQTGGMSEDAKIKATRTSIGTIKTAVEAYRLRAGAGLPDSLDAVSQKVGEFPALLNKAQLNDSWGNAFGYKKTSKYEFEIRSGGPDGQLNSGDDITN